MPRFTSLLKTGISLLLIAVLCFLSPVLSGAEARTTSTIPTISISQLPPEAQTTLSLIRKGGPFPYRQDGTVFANRERRLPIANRGYYREYTVKTPGIRTRGARRLVTGQGGEIYYTDNHYASFFRVR